MVLLAVLGLGGRRQTPVPVVHAVLFYSPTCPHCRKVITEDLVPLQDHYGDSLVILSLDVTTEWGSGLYQAAMSRYGVPRSEWGVPFMIVRDETLQGSVEIPDRLPALIEEGLASGGIDLPNFPTLISFLAEQGALRVIEPGHRFVFRSPSQPPADEAPRAEATDSTAATEPGLPLERGTLLHTRSTLSERFARDRTAGTLAVLLLVGMIVALARTFDPRRPSRRTWPEWATPALAGVGLFVALYLGFVEVTGNPATCGPIGDCNAVQQSAYATLFGVLPIGVLGVAAYVAILFLWLTRRIAPGRLRRAAALALWAVTLLGTLFSLYLTFLEPFVIGAVCMWCLTSALVMTLLLLTSAGPAARALQERGG